MSETRKIDPNTTQEGERRRRSHRRKRKKSVYKQVTRWIKNNPLKIIAIFSLGLLIYITALFVIRSKEERRLKSPDMHKSVNAD